MTASADASTRKRVGNLPADTTSFLGRRREIAEVKRLLSSSRVVTLTGPGGVGKSRLALRVAADVRRAFHDNVWFIELADLRDPGLLANMVADELELHDQSARPAIETLLDHLASPPALLVLDNCEQLVDECATFVQTLIRACPDLQVLATSRQSLGLLGESTLPVTPMRVPDPGRMQSPASIAHYDSVRLFIDRAAAAVPRFTINENNYATVARLCRDLDGIPLAIELTAVRLRGLSLEQIEERLTERYRLLTGGVRGAPERQRTLRALIDWSYDLCSQQERKVWARTAVFSGTFDLDAVEYVATGTDVSRHEMLNVVDSLVDKSIFMRESHEDTVRYRLLDTMREYGELRLRESGEQEAVRLRHRDWYAHLAARFASEWVGPAQTSWITRMRREHANLRAALDYCASEPGEALAGLRMATYVEDYWGIRGLHTELRHWLNRTLPAAPEATKERASALRMSGWFALLQGDLDSARPQLAEAARLAEELGIDAERGYVTQAFGLIALFAGDLGEAASLLHEAMRRFRAASLLSGEMFSLFTLGLTMGLNGQPERGLALLSEGIDRMARLGDVDWRSWCLWSTAFIEVVNGAPDRAEAAAKKALELQQRLVNRLAMAFTFDTLAWIAVRRGQYSRGTELFGAADSMWHAIGSSPDNYAPVATQHHGHLDLARRRLGDGFDAAYQRGKDMTSDAAISYALETEQVTARTPRTRPETPLTRREQQIAKLVAQGLTNKDIGAKLVISQRTVEAHVEHILTKLGFSSRTQIATWLAQHEPGHPMTL